MLGRTRGSRSLGRPRRGRDENIKMDFQDIGWESVDWIDLFQGWDKGELMIYFFTSRGNVGCPRITVLCGRSEVDGEFFIHNSHDLSRKRLVCIKGAGVAQRVPGGLGSQISMTFGT
jgi:hypothetical protein